MHSQQTFYGKDHSQICRQIKIGKFISQIIMDMANVIAKCEIIKKQIHMHYRKQNIYTERKFQGPKEKTKIIK